MLPRISTVSCDEADYILFSNHDLISNTLFRQGSWEPHLSKIASLFLNKNKNPLLIDIGANLGAFSIPLAKQIEKTGGQIYGFEPQRIVYYQLCANIILNRLDNYFALNQAVGETNKIIEIPEIDYSNHINIGAFSINHEFREKQGINRYNKNDYHPVSQVNLNSLQFNSAVSFLKLDAEGLELSILKGGLDFFEKNFFPPVLFECWNYDWFKQEKRELLDFFIFLGYRIDLLGGDNYLAQHKLHPIKGEIKKTSQNSISIHF